MASEKVMGDMAPVENSSKHEILVSNVKGKVKWFDIGLGYGFINRDDTNEDVFVHHTAIIKDSPKRRLSSLADGELVEFNVVQGKKGKEAANVCGPNGDQVKGSRFASNWYAGRFRSRGPGLNYGGGGRRFYGRVYRDHTAKNSQSEEVKRGNIEGEPKKELVGPKKHPRVRKNMAEGGRGGEKGDLKRSSSLPSDLGQYAGGNVHRRRRRGPRGPDGHSFFPAKFSGMKRRGPRKNERVNSEEKGKKIDDVETQLENEKGGREGGTKESIKETKSVGQRNVSEEKSEKIGERGLNEPSDKSQQSDGKKRSVRRRRTKKTSEVAGEKTESSQSSPEASSKVKDDSGDGNNEKGRPNRRGRGRRSKKEGGGRRSSSTEQSTRTSSTREGPKSEKEKRARGGHGDGSGTNLGAVGNGPKE